MSSWEFSDSTPHSSSWLPFSDADAARLDTLPDGGGEAALGPYGFTYHIDFRTMTQRNLQNGTIRCIRRTRMDSGAPSGFSEDFQGGHHGVGVHGAEDHVMDFDGYTTLNELVARGDVALLNSSWMIRQAQDGNVLSRRQELPASAFFSDTSQLDPESFLIKIVVISYCWLSPSHPDPEGLQLRLIATVTQKYEDHLKLEMDVQGCDVPALNGRYEPVDYEHEMIKYKNKATRHANIRPLRDPTFGAGWGWKLGENLETYSWCPWLGEDGIPPASGWLCVRSSVPRIQRASKDERCGQFGIFLDWGSLYQRNRTLEEDVAFNRSLATMTAWYACKATVKWLLTSLPRCPANVIEYDARGWPTYEMATAQLISRRETILDLGRLGASRKCALHQYREESFIGMTWCNLCGYALLGLRTQGQMCTLCGHVVCHACARIDTFHLLRKRCKMRSLRPPMLPDAFDQRLRSKHFTSSRTDPPRVMSLYRRAFQEAFAAAVSLMFADVGWGDVEIQELCAPLSYCGSLKSLYLQGNRITDVGMASLAKTLSGHRVLEIIDLWRNQIGDSGVKELAKTMPTLSSLRWLNLSHNYVSDDGAGALAKVLPECGSLTSLCMRPLPHMPHMALSTAAKTELLQVWRDAGKDPDQVVLE